MRIEPIPSRVFVPRVHEELPTLTNTTAVILDRCSSITLVKIGSKFNIYLPLYLKHINIWSLYSNLGTILARDGYQISL